MRIIIATLAAVLLCSNVSAVAGPLIMGHGGLSCGEVLKQERYTRVSSIIWVLGYLSGINSFASAYKINQDNLVADFDMVDVFIEKHCQESPADRLHEAAWNLTRVLYQK